MCLFFSSSGNYAIYSAVMPNKYSAYENKFERTFFVSSLKLQPTI